MIAQHLASASIDAMFPAGGVRTRA
jgi:hypothetical protein